MQEPGILEWLVLLLLLSVLVWWVSVQLRHLFGRFFSRRWPTANATIQKGVIARISSVRGTLAYGAFLKYTFAVQGAPYSGLFVIVGAEDRLAVLQSTLAGASLSIRYKPSDPSVSFIDDLYDPRFQGLNVTQDPEWLKQAPAPSIRDALEAESERNLPSPGRGYRAAPGSGWKSHAFGMGSGYDTSPQNGCCRATCGCFPVTTEKKADARTRFPCGNVRALALTC